MAALPFANSYTHPDASVRARNQKISPIGGVMQDHYSIMLLVLFGYGFPMLFVVGNWQRDDLETIVAALSWVVAYFAIVSHLFIFVMANNKQHVRNEIEAEIAPDATRSRYLDKLLAHCDRQNSLAGLILITPLGIPVLLALVFDMIGGHTKESLVDVAKLFRVRA